MYYHDRFLLLGMYALYSGRHHNIPAVFIDANAILSTPFEVKVTMVSQEKKEKNWGACDEITSVLRSISYWHLNALSWFKWESIFEAILLRGVFVLYLQYSQKQSNSVVKNEVFECTL